MLDFPAFKTAAVARRRFVRLHRKVQVSGRFAIAALHRHQPNPKTPGQCRHNFKRVAAAPRDRQVFDGVSSTYRRRASSRRCFVPKARRLKDQYRPRRQLKASAVVQFKYRARGVPGHASPCTSRRVLPNPSFKATPNSVACLAASAGPSAHFALAVQRATPSVPA